MTFNDNAKIDSSRTRRRGRTGAIAGGGGVVGIIAIALLSQLFGVDLSGLVGGAGGGSNASDEAIVGCDTGADANANLDCRLAGAGDSLDSYWAGEVEGYRPTNVRLFDGQTDTGCGGATSAVGPFYCPPDETIYIDTAFFGDLRTKYGANGGPLAEMYVLAHEWGHHIQNVTGVMTGLDTQTTGPTSDGVRLEVQADCYAGAWVAAASQTVDEAGTPLLEPVTDQQVADALSAASAVGDDRIQESATGQVNPETWTHGSSEQRQKWFTSGYNGGPAACDTFGASAAEL
jgi:predicted metalloprotease